MTVNPDGAEQERAGLTDVSVSAFFYLRVLITEVCNFPCVYCLPNGYAGDPETEFLSVSEIRWLVAGFPALGATKMRPTGGEPSVRTELPAMIAAEANTPGIARVAMTTNGWKLADQIGAQRDASLTHLNVGVDSLDRTSFARLTGNDRLAERGWTALLRHDEDGPGVAYRHPDYLGRFGLIVPYGDPYSDGCNRLTARGKLRLCLFGEGGVELRDLLDEATEPGRLEARILEALPAKARGHSLMLARSGDLRRMADIGG